MLKLKTQDFRIRTRNRQLGDPTRLADRIFQTGLHLLEKETDGTRYRLIGIGVSDLSDADKADPPDLVDLQSRKRALAEGAIDSAARKVRQDGRRDRLHVRQGPQRPPAGRSRKLIRPGRRGDVRCGAG